MDGTETAECVCGQTHTRPKVGSRLDHTAPEGTIQVVKNEFKSFICTITFGIFFKDQYDVTITASDEQSGVKEIAYFVSEMPVSGTEIAEIGAEKWIKATSFPISFSIEDAGKCIVYARITDQAENVSYISTDGLVLDQTRPVIEGLTNEKIYCGEVTFTVSDEYLDYVLINDKKTTDYTLQADGSIYEVKAVDKAGNVSDCYQVTVNNGHTLMKHDLKAATCTEAGNIEYWSCEVCGKLFSDEACMHEIAVTDIVIVAAGHEYEVGQYEHNATDHWQVCKKCGTETSCAEHSMSEYVSEGDATCEEDGHKTATCSVCGYQDRQVEEGSKTGHKYEKGKCTSCGAADPNYKPEAENQSPATGDEGQSESWILLSLTAMGALLLTVMRRRKVNS